QLVTEMNLFGTVYSCNAVAPIMKQQRSGKIITVSSVAGTAPVERLSEPYWAPNRGVTRLTRMGFETRQSRSSGNWLDALDGADFWDSSLIDPIGLGPLCTSLSGSVGRTSCDTPTSQSTASGRLLRCVREYFHDSCRPACSACNPFMNHVASHVLRVEIGAKRLWYVRKLDRWIDALSVDMTEPAQVDWL